MDPDIKRLTPTELDLTREQARERRIHDARPDLDLLAAIERSQRENRTAEASADEPFDFKAHMKRAWRPTVIDDEGDE
jgi:hypothetical protein